VIPLLSPRHPRGSLGPHVRVVVFFASSQNCPVAQVSGLFSSSTRSCDLASLEPPWACLLSVAAWALQKLIFRALNLRIRRPRRLERIERCSLCGLESSPFGRSSPCPHDLCRFLSIPTSRADFFRSPVDRSPGVIPSCDLFPVLMVTKGLFRYSV